MALPAREVLVFPRFRSRHRNSIIRIFVLLSAFSLACCDEEKQTTQLKEVIDVQATCSEDDGGQRDGYAGKIFRWQTVKTGSISTYGTLFGKVDSPRQPDTTKPSQDELPPQVSFSQIDIDTDLQKWTLHGVSSLRGSTEAPIKTYDSTCEIEVVRREIHK